VARLKQKLKDGAAETGKRESFTKLFASAQNLPAQMTKPHLSKLTSPTDLEAKRETAKKETAIHPSHNTKSLMATVPSPPPAAPTHAVRRKSSNDRLPNGWFLLIPAIGLTTFVLLSPNGEITDLKPHERQLAGYEKPEFRESVDFYRKSTGWKMNRERIATDLENRVGAPAVAGSTMPLAKPDIMKGLPLDGEKNPRQFDEQAEHVKPTYPDADVALQLQREQQAIAFDKAARKQFIQELKANAAQAGYEVQVDSDGNALFKRIGRKPSSRPNKVFDDTSSEDE
jgi:hypothetical protein